MKERVGQKLVRAPSGMDTWQPDPVLQRSRGMLRAAEWEPPVIAVRYEST